MIRRNRRFWTALLVGALGLTLSGCGLKLSPLPGPGPEPKPTPTPEPTPPPVEECLPGLPWCHELVPPAACGECKHNPTSDPAHCEKAPKCEEPPPVPQGCILAGVPTQEAVGHAATLGATVNEALAAVTSCEVGTRCVIRGNPQDFQARVEAELRKRGLCAGQHERHTDEIAAARKAAEVWEGYHVATGEGWCLSEEPLRADCPKDATTIVVWYPERASYKGAWLPPGTPGPPPVSACPEPRPAEAGQIGGIGRIGMKPHGGVRIDGNVVKILDATPNVYAGKAYEVLPSENYCAKIGSLAGDGVSGNTWCPARLEGNPDRSACEKWGLRAKGSSTPGDMRWLVDQGRVLVNLDNSFQAGCDGCTWLKACNADLSFCSDPVPAP